MVLSAALALAAAETDLKRHWPAAAANPMHAAVARGIGFSFEYLNQRVGPALPEGWSAASSSQGGLTELELRHTSGLVARQRIRVWKPFEAIEYTVVFRNEARERLPAVRSVDALDLTLAGVLNGLSIVSSGGGQRDEAYPPESYALHRRFFAHHQALNRPGRPGSPMLLSAQGGRSANGHLPFFFIDHQGLAAGVFVAIGWTGQWTARLVGSYVDNTLHVAGGMPGVNVRLEPGEQISGPSILLGAYQGDLADGANRLRRLIREHYAPRVAGQELGPVAVYDHWWNINVEFDEAYLRQLADVAAQIGQEYFLLDAGWYAGAPTTAQGFAAGVGNWEEVDRNKFPNGLKPFADYVRAQGLKFGMWFEPERVARGSLLARQHPDWVLWLPDSVPQDKPYTIRSHGLLDYGRREVRDWVVAMMEGYVRDLDVRYLRHDYNQNPLAYWNAHDEPNRRGLRQIRHLEGLAEVIDRLRQRHPQVVLEGCASGGRRIDLETIRRFHTTWIGDHTLDPRTVRWNLHGLHHFLPGNYLYVAYSWPMPYQSAEDLTAASLMPFMGGAFGTSGRLDRWPASFRATAARHFAVHRKLRPLLMEDYYPLTPQVGDDARWAAWQFHNPRSGEGFVQAFRLDSAQGVRRFPLRALEAGATYEFRDPLGEAVLRATGAQAASPGLEFRLDPHGSRIWMYSPKPR